MLKTFGSHVRANVVGYIALFVALGGTTYAATGGNFILGQSNSAGSTTSLTRTGANAGKGLQVTNTSTTPGATALGLTVASGHAPFTVNSAGKVANLNADAVDGKHISNWKVAPVISDVGPLPVEGTFASSGGRLLFMASGSGFRSTGNARTWGTIGMEVSIDGTPVGDARVYTNERDSHKAFVTDYFTTRTTPGNHTLRLDNVRFLDCNTTGETTTSVCTTTDFNDRFEVAVIEIP